MDVLETAVRSLSRALFQYYRSCLFC